MADKKLLQRLDVLRSLIEKYDHNYYVKDRPLVPDDEYDRTFLELRLLEEQHPELVTETSPTKRLSGNRSDAFSSVEHGYPMLSIRTETDTTTAPIDAFQIKVAERLRLPGWEAFDIFAELKYDGLAVNIVYKDGILVSAGTRGDGVVGEDVTENVKMVRSIPLRLKGVRPKLLEVRGEILMLKKVFAELNEELVEAGETPFANPRNAAAGSLRQLDASVTKSRRLHFMAYGIGSSDGWKVPSTQADLVEELKKMGFPSAPVSLLAKAAQMTEMSARLYAFYRRIEKERSLLPFDIDGIVYKVNSMDYQKLLGITGREPNWSIAHKYLPEEAKTRLLDIEVQIGRTGALTPVARLEPVAVGGVLVSNATLNNEARIHEKDIRIGDMVIVRRAGDVIPEILKSLPEERTEELPIFRLKEKYPVCPCCGSAIEKDEDEAVYRCVGDSYCHEQVEGGLLHFVSKKAVDIAGIGEKFIQKFVEHEVVNDFADLFKLTVDDFVRCTGRSAEYSSKLVDQIQSKKEIPLARFLYGLGIRGTGLDASKVIAEKYGTLEKVMEVFSQPEGDPLLGPITNARLCEYFTDRRKLSVLEKAKDLQVIVIPHVRKKVSENAKKYVITGSFPGYTREDVSKLIEESGNLVTNSVSKKVAGVVVGENSGSKVKDAEKLGIPILTLEDLFSSIQ